MPKKPKTREPKPLPPKLAELERLAGEALGYACGFVNMKKHPLRSYPYQELNAVVKKLETACQEVAHILTDESKPRGGAEPFRIAGAYSGKPGLDPLRTVLAWSTAVRDAFRIVAGAAAGISDPGVLRNELGQLAPERVQQLLEQFPEPFDVLLQHPRISKEVRQLLTTPVSQQAVAKAKEAIHDYLRACTKRRGGVYAPRGCVTALELATIIEDSDAGGLKLKKKWDMRDRRNGFYPPDKGTKKVRGGHAYAFDPWLLLARAIKAKDVPADTIQRVRKDLARFLLRN